ncbi:hypothetical protein [Vibrio sp. CAU 1672]|uniref:hypothetical protein n=1 Tax=Vibrio sp. CAU 1672 TaxID=3032594 RepID=UPI0023DC8B5E|nr:hypothetical protein [Vibrio sp. CAU 1672]MDF2152742.1 hypothetical protein [Vibrio sp. CAU 1672]
MDNPKTYILVVVGAMIVLLLSLWLTSSSGETRIISATVISNTLTQSLDGQRRYLTVESEITGQVRVSVSTSVQCPEGATATFQQTTDTLFEQPLTFIKCE